MLYERVENKVKVREIERERERENENENENEKNTVRHTSKYYRRIINFTAKTLEGAGRPQREGYHCTRCS